MNGRDILIGLSHVDEQLIHEAEIIKKSNKNNRIFKYAMSIAASFAVVTLSFVLYQNAGNTPPVSRNPDIFPPTISGSKDDINSTKSYELQFNNANYLSASRIVIKGHFCNELDEARISKVLPIISQKYAVDGAVHYSSADGVATLHEVATSITIDEKMNGKITIAPNEIVNDYTIVGEPIISQIEDTPVEAGLFITDKNSRGEQNYIYYASFMIDGIAYYMEFVSENSEAEDSFTSIVADVVLGGKADLSVFDNPTIPKIIEKDLTENQAYSDVDFGKYLIEIPEDYRFNSANRLLNQNSDILFASWSKGYNDIRIQASRLNEDSKARIVSPKDTELFDMSLYPIPWGDSMPRDKSHIIENPVFKAEDLTLDLIKLRGYTLDEMGEPSDNSLNMRFSVLYGDIVVEVNSEGLSAEYLFDELTSLLVE